jgi:hypothetical protein
MTDAERDRLTEVCQRVEDTAWSSDRAFFEQHPQRRYRLRPAWDAEIEQNRLRGECTSLPAGLCWWVAVHLIAPGVRMRQLLGAGHDLPIDPPEKVAREMFERACPRRFQKQRRELELNLKQVLGRFPGAA